MGEIVDLYAGPGGWSEALRLLGRSADEIGIEYDPNACATRAAAGHRTLQADVSTIDEQDYADLEGLIASPPCQAFSSAGKGAARDLIPELLDSIRNRRWADRADPDPRVWLIVDLGRFLERLDPEWIALEQVPQVLPLWEAYAEILRERRYNVWTGILNAADYGVPQTRKRAILVAHRSKPVERPQPTHAKDPTPTLFGAQLLPWRTMAEALPHIAGSFVEYRRGGDRIHEGRVADTDPSDTVTTRADRWRIGFPRRDDRGDSSDGYRERDWRYEPAQTVTEKARSWKMNTGQDFRIPGERATAQTRESSDPSSTITGQTARWHITEGETSLRLSFADALTLQSFRPDYPVHGTNSKQFEQIGNAIPPRLAWHVLRTVLTSRVDQEQAGGIEFPT